MNNIYAIGNLATGSWDLIVEELRFNQVDLHIGFKDAGPVAGFDNLKFKYELVANGSIVTYGAFPLGSIKYIQSDQTYLETIRLTCDYDTSYNLRLWAENGGNAFESTADVQVLKPDSPYPSWSWNGEAWIPPIPCPDSFDVEHCWNETLQEWVK